MKLMSSLPEFIEGSKLLKLGKWPEALPYLNQVHVISTSPQLSGYIGLAHFYIGDFKSAVNAFKPHHPLWAAAASLELHFPRPVEMRNAVRNHVQSDDPWSRYFRDPSAALPGGFVESFRLFSMSPSLESFKNIPVPRNVQEQTALAQASLLLAHRLPVAAGQALADAEELARFSPEGKALAPWFICHSLQLHGKKAVSSGQAVLAEALFTAAREQAAFVFNPRRREICEFRCDRALGELLSKWQKREDKGVELLESVAGRFDLAEIADASEIFLPPPDFSLF